jgi:hypothetical protein
MVFQHAGTGVKETEDFQLSSQFTDFEFRNGVYTSKVNMVVMSGNSKYSIGIRSDTFEKATQEHSNLDANEVDPIMVVHMSTTVYSGGY